KTVSVEHDARNPALKASLGNRLAHGLGGRQVALALEPLAHAGGFGRSRGQRTSALVGDNLGVNMMQRAEDREPWPLVDPDRLAPHPVLAQLAFFRSFNSHNRN